MNETRLCTARADGYQQQKRNNKTADIVDKSKPILDELAPLVSGREWRLVQGTRKNLYERYKSRFNELHPSMKPLGRHYFTSKLLHSGRVHYAMKPDFCPHCLEFKNDKNPHFLTKAKYDKHVDLLRNQMAAYMEQRKLITNGLNKTF